MIKIKCLLTIITTALLGINNLSAQTITPQKLYSVFDPGVPAYPEPVIYTQPNGQKVTIQLKGDGALSWAESTDEYKLLANDKGAFCYAVEDNIQGIKASDILASDVVKRKPEEITFLKKINPSTFFKPSFIQSSRSRTYSLLKSSDVPQNAFPTKGSRKLIAILVEFTDTPFSKTRQEFDDLFNKKGYSYNGATGSVSDYFSDNSFGAMNLSVDVVGPFKLSQNMAYYGAKDDSKNDKDPRSMITEAITLANPTVDFSQYDNDKDGTIDGVYVIFAGYGQESGASTDAIWSHAWSIPSKTFDNTKISRYSCSPELKGNENNNIVNKYPTHIGVICHEFLHVCGLPDYYDTDGSKTGGDSRDLGRWDPMAGGSWNNSGRTPPYVNCYSRLNLNWGTIENLKEGNTQKLQPHYKSNIGYSRTTLTNEHFFFENRQRKGWDAYLPGHGLIVYHMQYDYSRWSTNTINVDPNHQYFDLVEATPLNPSDAYSPFPGLGNVTSFTPKTTPAFVNWDGTNLKMQITNIEEADEVISFNTLDYNNRNIYLKLTHENSGIQTFDAAYNNVKYTSNNEGVAKIRVPINEGSINPKITITNSTAFDTQLSINSADSVYTIPLKRLDFSYAGTYAKIPKASIQIPSLEKINLSGYQIANAYTPDFTSTIPYTIIFDNGQQYSKILTANPRSRTETVELSYNQYVVSVTNGGQKVSGYELTCNNISFVTNDNGLITIYMPTTKDKFTLASTSDVFHKYNTTFTNTSTTSNSIAIETIKRSKMEAMTIAPNPIVELPMVIFCSEDGVIDFYNTLGNKLYSQDVKTGKNLVTAKTLKKGVILVRFKGKETTETKRALIL